MNYNRALLILGHVMIWWFALDKLIALLLINRMSFGSLGPDDYSIFSSRSAFIAWHVWGIIVGAVTSYAMWKKHRMLFMIGVLLMLIVQFYPYFTANQGTKTPPATEVVGDSLR
jgi:hypothetical protein